MPADEYAAWERHIARGLAPEVWCPLILIDIATMIASAFGGNAKQYLSQIPWMQEDPSMRTEDDVLAERKKMRETASRRHAIEALAAIRLR